MSHAPRPAHQERSLEGFPDVPLIIELLQNQIDELIATVRTQQDQLVRQSARIAALERS